MARPTGEQHPLRAGQEVPAAEQVDRRAGERRRRWRREGAYLAPDEFESGVRCRGCGELIVDGLGDWPPLAEMSAEERAEYDAADAQHRERHGDCQSPRWSVAGSRAQHCGTCCPPPPPLSTENIDHLSRFIAAVGTDPQALDEWQLLLSCDHVVARVQHRIHESWTMYAVKCPECNVWRVVVTAQRVGVAAELAERERLSAEPRGVIPS